MRILIIGYDPHDIGGTQNYTRPLSLKFIEMGHTVFYLYSGAWNRKYNWLMKPFFKINRKDFPFEYAELINSPNCVYNFGIPLLDICNSQTEKLFIRYLKKIKPDVMHVHSRCGLPASVIEIASKKGIKVFNTIHVYGLLCQKRIMIDNSGKLCGGPSDLKKCVDCMEPVDIKKLKLTARIENTNKDLLKLLVNIKRKFARKKNGEIIIPPKNYFIADYEKKKIKEGLRKRLNYMINLMNHHVVVNICVSTDVKRTIMRYGVNEDKILVQHIGSVIAQNQKRDIRKLHTPLVIGNIGGVDYYKGTHILLDAINKIKNNNFILKIFGKYEQKYLNEILQGKENLPIEFIGRYKPEDLPEILQQIDIMVLPSICNDTAPQTIFESYSAGIPIIASNIGGFPDFVKNGVNGYLFRAEDSQALADKLDKILNSTDKIKSFSDNIPSLKTITENAIELLSMYGESIGRSN